MNMEEFTPKIIEELKKSLIEEFRNADEKRRTEMIRKGLFKRKH